jgi:hypothetical protein
VELKVATSFCAMIPLLPIPAAASALHHHLYGAGERGRHTVFETVRKSKQRFGFYADQLRWSGCAHQSSKAKTIDRSRRPLEWET